MSEPSSDFRRELEARGVSRREFMGFCSAMAVMFGLPKGATVAEMIARARGDAKAAAEGAAKLSGVRKVLLVEADHLAEQVAEEMAALIVPLMDGYDAAVAPATARGKNLMPRVAALLGVNQISEGGSWFAAYGSDVKSSQWNIDGLDRTAPEGGDLSWSMNDELVRSREEAQARALQTLGERVAEGTEAVHGVADTLARIPEVMRERVISRVCISWRRRSM